MTITQVKGRAEGMPRAGTFALSLLADPLDVCVLRALRPGPKALADLRRAVGSPPQTTMRGHLRTLTKVGALAKRRQNEFPGNLDYELTDAGHSLLTVAGVLEAWLADSPDGALALGSAAAKSAVRALMQGWSTTLVRALVARPLTLTELDRIINLSYPSLERRLVAMRLAGQITTTSGRGRGTPYPVTAWLRHAIAPLGAAARWERANDAPGASPIGRLDVEAAFLLAMPLIRLAPGLRGACRLTVEIPGRSESRQAGVLVVV
ncbi:MAG TPA: winged helix-turn-helix transcriptional regulator, partial [Solirubrobacterales bacterium]|nr:winged helix-turn-helix transcriptional regulator [Solirubrobacterales bacterium]